MIFTTRDGKLSMLGEMSTLAIVILSVGVIGMTGQQLYIDLGPWGAIGLGWAIIGAFVARVNYEHRLALVKERLERSR